MQSESDPLDQPRQIIRPSSDKVDILFSQSFAFIPCPSLALDLLVGGRWCSRRSQEDCPSMCI